MSLSIGIVGLPNVGKSTLFNALVKNGQALASNYPFATIEPNVGVVEVPDPRLAQLAHLVKPEKVIPATVEFLDIAGIIKGASQGEGLGNKFLSHIRLSAAILLVARFFEHPDVIHVNGKVDPKSDLETVILELVLADLETATKAVDRYTKSARGGDKQAAECLAFSNQLLGALEAGKLASTIKPQSEADHLVLRELNLLTAKPMLVAANVSENQLSLTPEQLFKDYQLETLLPSSDWIIPICAQVEAELAGLEEAERREFLESYGLAQSGMDRLVSLLYRLLGLQTYFTAGPKEVRAWTIKRGDTAPKAAAVIHTDFEKGFIRAEVIAFKDYLAAGNESGAKEAGKFRLEGKEYLVQDGDVMHFRFNV